MASPRRLSVLLIAALALQWWSTAPAAAHTAFESSDPTDGAVVDQPVEEMRLTFTNDATPVGDGIEVLDPSGQLRSVEATSSDGRTWVAHLRPPVDAGRVGVRWTVQAPDAHPISGSFTFTVARTDDSIGGPSAEMAGDSPPTSSAPAEPQADMAFADPSETNDEIDASELAAFLAVEESAPQSADSVALAGRVLGLAVCSRHYSPPRR